MRAPLILAILVLSVVAGAATRATAAVSASALNASAIFGGTGFEMGLGATDDLRKHVCHGRYGVERLPVEPGRADSIRRRR